ncbi:GntR family transcriptional regulator [Micromonospora sp. LZ34]
MIGQLTSIPDRSKHAAIREELRAMVFALAEGELLPAERHLAERWGVARMTVRQALAALAREGIVRTVHGRGTVRAPESMQLRVRLGSFADAVREHDMAPSTQMLEHVADQSPPVEVAAFLKLDPGEAALRIRRLRLGDDVPLALERTWLAASLVPDLTEDVLSNSLYHYLEGRGLLPDSGEESVVADLPNNEEIRLLDLVSSRPVLRLVRRAFAGHRPIEYAEAVLPADRYELWFPLQGKDTQCGWTA